MRMKKSLVIHPFFLAIFPPLFLLSHNIEQTTTEDINIILIAIAITTCSALLFWSLLSFILKDKKKAALVVSLSLLLFFSYGHFAPLLEGLWKVLYIGDFVIGHHKVLLAIWGIIFLIGAYFSIRTLRNLNTFTSVLNVVAVTLVVISLINIGVHTFRPSPIPWDNDITENGEAGIPSVESLDTPPDIYYIILDGYASSSALEEIYNYDNHEFIDYLTEKGFFVASESRTNYPLTYLSLASSLNMEYINYLSNIVGVESKSRAVPYEMITQSKVMGFLKLRGYKFIHVSSGWGPTNTNRFADLDIKCGRYNESQMVLIQTTMAGPFMHYFLQEDLRGKVLCTFSQLAEVPAIEGPKFVFAHILSPHPPYVFGANGEPVPETKLELTGGVWAQKELYLNQLIFINTKVETLVDEILSKSEVPPIIILQADHGTSVMMSGCVKFPTKDMVRERFSIFNAYYLPQGGDNLLYNSITPVNTFRLIFNLYFGANYELLGDECYYSTRCYPYKFIDVTDKVR